MRLRAVAVIAMTLGLVEMPVLQNLIKALSVLW
jgi:hypothetical protein